MNKFGYEYQSDFARKYFAQGFAQGIAESVAEGKAEGRAEGKAEEARRLVLLWLTRLVGLLGPELQARVEALDVERLEALADALLDFKALADLQTWLEQDA